MADFETRTVIKVFLASPGDLADERRRAKDVADEVNRTVGRTWGIAIELLGWEDTLPGAGRPQELINRDVDSCDLFIGILWRRWGQPTGEYSSGFEEEFERARARRQTTVKPGTVVSQCASGGRPVRCASRAGIRQCSSAALGGEDGAASWLNAPWPSAGRSHALPWAPRPRPRRRGRPWSAGFPSLSNRVERCRPVHTISSFTGRR